MRRAHVNWHLAIARKWAVREFKWRKELQSVELHPAIRYENCSSGGGHMVRPSPQWRNSANAAIQRPPQFARTRAESVARHSPVSGDCFELLSLGNCESFAPACPSVLSGSCGVTEIVATQLLALRGSVLGLRPSAFESRAWTRSQH